MGTYMESCSHETLSYLAGRQNMHLCECVYLFLYLFICLLQDTVSVHRPGFYAERFKKFMCSTVFRTSSCKSKLCHVSIVKLTGTAEIWLTKKKKNGTKTQRIVQKWKCLHYSTIIRKTGPSSLAWVNRSGPNFLSLRLTSKFDRVD